MNKTTVVFHSADYDGIFCREIARKFLPDAELIGWDFADKPLAIPEGRIYVLDLPADRVFGHDFTKEASPVPWSDHFASLHAALKRVIWIDHHGSSIASHPVSIPGYRIDGVAACRLAWQWFTEHRLKQGAYWSEGQNKTFDWLSNCNLPEKLLFVDRKVSEPLAVRLAGEYDVWDHRGDGDVEFQFGLDSEEGLRWDWLLADQPQYAQQIVAQGKCAMACYKKRDADILRERSFIVNFEGLKLIALNTARCNSNTFALKDVPETGHDALMGFFFDGKVWRVSLYHAKHRTDLDLSKIAVKHGGGGHRGACGFVCDRLPFISEAPSPTPRESPERASPLGNS